MSTKEYKHLGMRIDADLYAKLQYLAKYEGRSVSGQVMLWIRQGVLEFEKQTRKIDLESEETQEALRMSIHRFLAYVSRQ